MMNSKLSEFSSVIALAAVAILMAAAACGINGEETRADQKVATAAATTESSASVFPPNTATPRANETAPGEIEAAARNLLADELDVNGGDFRLDSTEGVAWSDTSLGCPQEDYAYAQVITPGYKLIFDLADTSYAVHTNSDGSHMVICGDGH